VPAQTSGTPARPGTSTLVPWALVPVGCALLVAADPYLSAWIPRTWWAKLGLDSLPLKLSPVVLLVAAASTALWPLIRRTGAVQELASGRHERVFAVLFFAACQANGIRIGPFDVLDAVIGIFFLIWLADRLRYASHPVVVSGVVWSGLLLLLLDLPHLTHQYAGTYLVGVLSLGRVVLSAFLLVNFVRGEDSLRFATNVFATVAVASGAIAIAQFCLSFFAGIDLHLFQEPEEAAKATPLGVVTRAFGLAATAQHLSGYLTFALPFVLVRATAPGLRGRRRAAWLAGAGLVLGGIAMSWNFGAILVAAVLLALFPFVRWPRLALHLALGGVALLLFAYVSGLLGWAYDVTLGDGGVSKGLFQRRVLLEIGIEKLQRDPWIGTGLLGMHRFSGNYWNRPVHNAYVQAATEISLIAAGVLVVTLLALVTRLGILASGSSRFVRDLVLPSLLSLLALSALMLSEPMLDHSNTWMILGLAQAVVLAARPGAEGERFRATGDERT
jgi:hypothetical protein